MYLNKQNAHFQRGFLMPLAMFIIVVMGIFAVVLSRNTIQTSTSAVQEITNVEAFYAAESGAQAGMQTLFFPDASSRQAVDTRCGNINTVAALHTLTFTATGLNNCTAVVSCSCTYQDGNNCVPGTATNYTTSTTTTNSYYQIVSVGTCGSGNLRAVRTIEVGAFMEQE